MRVKVCGIQRFEDAEAAVKAGAWALGFIFHRSSMRYIEPEAVQEITRCLPGEILTVGVFVDAPIDVLNDFVRRAGLRAAQLHGSEDAAYAARVEAEQVIKAFRVGDDFDPSQLEAFAGHPVLLDAYHPSAAGGTGTSFDWGVARKAGEKARVILAGGIRPENVARAIRQARPWAIDVSSGVEVSPGVKDPGRILRLFEAIRTAEEP